MQQENKMPECLNCSKVGCQGVRHRLCTDQKGELPYLVTECQWCDARLIVKNPRSWLEYGGMLALIIPFFILEYWPQTPWLYLVVVVVVALLVIVWAKSGVVYHLEHRASASSAPPAGTTTHHATGQSS